MYLQTSRLQYNLQKVGVFQTAHSDKNIQAEACRNIIPQKCEQFKQKAYIRTPKEAWTIGFQDFVAIWNLMELNDRKAPDFGKQI